MSVELLPIRKFPNVLVLAVVPDNHHLLQRSARPEARAAREANEAKRKLESEADMHLYRVSSYLEELESDPDGCDFEGQRYKYAQKIKQEIRTALIEDLPLDLTTGGKRAEQLVDEWLANHWKSPNAA